MLCRMVFLMVPEEYEDVTINGEVKRVWKTYDFFPLSDARLTKQGYVYYTMEHVALIFTWVLFSFVAVKYPFIRPVAAFEVIDAIDFWLTCNNVWWVEDGFPVGWNVAGLGVVLLCLIFIGSRKHDIAQH